LRYEAFMRRALLLPLVAVVLTSCATGFHGSRLQEIDSAVEQAIAQKKIPGGVLHIEHDGAVYERVWGNRALVPEVEAMTADTIFDAASITKTMATAPSIWLLIQQGKIALDEPAKTYLPGIADGRITIRHLLTHTSGLTPSLDLRDGWRGYDEGIRRAMAEVPRNAPGYAFRYSDVNFILLGEIVRRVSGEPLDVFATKNIFEPLGMSDTRFRPVKSGRIAPTEMSEEGMLRGVVHDPTSRAMGGVAGHAGLFTTAADVAKYARALLAGKMFPAAMTQLCTPPGVVARTCGFDLDSGYSRPRGDHFSPGSYGHTGWTGGFFWVDPATRSFYVFLSNRVHPDGRGSVTALQKKIGTLVAESLKGVAFCGTVLPSTGPVPPACPPRRIGWITGGADAQNGIDVLYARNYEPLRGLRVGLITNHTGLDRPGNPTIDLLRSAPGVTLVALFSPEHGIRGTADEENLGDSKDALSGLPVYSLYGERRKPSAEQLAELDALVFDIQDIGARFYTYISTMGLAMEAAAEAHKKFIVLDRVNPIGGALVEGPMLEGDTDFIAWHPIPVRHGMTVGELAKMFAAERKLDLALEVIPVRGWKRAQWLDEAGLAWVNPSPNMRSLTAAGLYPGLGLLESAVSVGRGTPTPFEIVGAPYVDGEALIREVGAIPGVVMTPISFTPDASIHKGERCGGIRIAISDRSALRSVDLGVALASALARLYPAQFPVDKMQRLLRHKPTLEAIRRGAPLSEIRSLWDTSAFEERRRPFLLYGD
jgi:uncharacterized protein YbbC (DUF1343 family)/CubicO group peptidase (beta-lactamase class C family)